MLRRLSLLSYFAFVSLCAASSFAATVTLVKDSKLVITLESGEAFQKDQKVKVLNAKNQTVAVALITLVKGNKAVATIEKGKAKVGLKADLTNASKAASNAGTASTGGNIDGKAVKKPAVIGKRYVGAVGGIVMDSADVSFTPEGGGTKTKVSLSGMAFAAKGLYEIPWSRSYSLRLFAGVEQFNVEGPTKASCNGKCEIKITYVTADAWARFLFAQTGYKPWAGVGLGLLYPLSKSSTTLDADSIKPTSIFSFGGGIDYQLSARSQIPVQIEYGFLPSSADVKASALAVRVGYSFVY